MDDKLETANDTVRQLRVTISNLQNEAQLLDATKSNTALELTQTKEELRESRMTIANSESLIEAALRKQKEVFDAEVIKAAKTAKLYATMAEEEHKTALDSLSQQLQVAQSTATRLTGTRLLTSSWRLLNVPCDTPSNRHPNTPHNTHYTPPNILYPS